MQIEARQGYNGSVREYTNYLLSQPGENYETSVSWTLITLSVVGLKSWIEIDGTIEKKKRLVFSSFQTKLCLGKSLFASKQVRLMQM